MVQCDQVPYCSAGIRLPAKSLLHFDVRIFSLPGGTACRLFTAKDLRGVRMSAWWLGGGHFWGCIPLGILGTEERELNCNTETVGELCGWPD